MDTQTQAEREISEMRERHQLPADIDPQLYADKVRVGLTHAQAIAVIRQSQPAAAPKSPAPPKPPKPSGGKASQPKTK